jgi:hypothetical protein
VTPVQRVGDNRRSLELRNGRIPRIFRNNLAYEDDTDSQFTCILRNFGLEHGFVHLQGAEFGYPWTEQMSRKMSRNVWETRSSHSQKRSEPAAHPCRGPGGQAGDEHGGSPWFKGGVEPRRMA